METVNQTINHVSNLPKTKKIILIIMAAVVILFILDIVNTYYSNKQKFTNLILNKKVSKKIEKMDPQTISNATTDTKMLVFGDVTIDPTKKNVTLYFAHWCGHCKQFLSTTWEKFSSDNANNSNIKVNTVDCTEVKSEIKTPAGKTIAGFPTVILNYVNADGEYIEEEYNGGRSYEVFNKYVEQLGASNA